MLRKTGTGKVHEFVNGSPVTHALLHNFDFDGHDVKTEHTNWLDQNVANKLLMPQYSIWMRGTASQVGDAGYNLKLSKRRVQEVESYLLEYGVEASRIQTEWKGEFLSTSTNKDDERDRAVEIRMQGAVKLLPTPPVKPPPSPPPAPPISDTFRLRLLGSAQVGKVVDVGKWLGRLSKAAKLRKLPKVGLAADFMFFEIQDIKNSTSGFYLYVGVGGGGGFYWMSATHKGPWNYFHTSKPILVSEFDGPGRFTTGGFYKWSKNYIDLLGTPSGVRRVNIPIETGLTFGGGVSTTVGTYYYMTSAKASP